jgi:hypothetical protein
MNREEHTKNSKIENHIWEIAKILNKNDFVEDKIIQKAKDSVTKILKK